MEAGETVSVARTLPLGWRVKLPSSWEVEHGSESSDVASMQATRRSAEATDPLGIMALAVFARSAVAKPRAVAEPFLSALADGGLRVLRDDFVEESCEDLDAGSFERSWLLVSGVTRSQTLPGEVSCRVLRHERAWVLAGVLGPRAEDDQDAWAENQRALSVVTKSLRIRG